MSLETLAVQNFQRHARFTVEFAPGVTVFWGLNGSGKSALLRAIRLAALNAPAGEGYIRRGAKGCVVTLGVDGRLVTRKRGPGVNVYLLDDQEYVAFGNTVPAPVAALLNVGEQNFQRQLDGPFWLGLSAGGLARELNAILDLDVIDRSNAAAAAGLRAATAATAAAYAELNAATAEVEKWGWADKAAAAYAGVIAAGRAAAAAREKHDELVRLSVRVVAARDTAARALRYAQACAQLTGAAKAAGKAATKAGGLRAALGAYRGALRTARKPPSFAPVAAAYAEAAAAAARAAGLRSVARGLQGARAAAKTAAVISAAALQRYCDAVGGACPLCGQSIEENEL